MTATRATGSAKPRRTGRSAKRPYEQLAIEHVVPSIDGGRFPAKGIVGDRVWVEATVFRHGHERLRVAIQWRAPDDPAVHEAEMALLNPGLDRWGGAFPIECVGRHTFAIVAWTDQYASWLAELAKRVDAKQADVASEIAEGIAQVERAVRRAKGDRRKALDALLRQLREAAADPARVLALASAPDVVGLVAGAAPREDETRLDPELEIRADRPRARVGAWYELFVRSQGTEPGRSGTFADAERRLADIAAMGFDVVYLAPIHPIGETSRKGPNNRPAASPGDPGSPWAIGSRHGGHTAIEPALGTLEDFDRFVAAADARGMEIALDFAIQCSPDHPWVAEHPEWFYRRPDGTIRYAENPPKKYEDIYPLNFDTPDWKNLWTALCDVVRFWAARGVRIFRVDNPHTKPIGFWTWLIETVQRDYPDTIFLAEAFTRPPMMKGLAKRGFTQSYTYFTWRNTKAELTEYLTELTAPDTAQHYRPNFFVNTPDILPPVLQTGLRAAFKLRLVLGATLSPTYGIYSGFELCEHAAIPGREEYLDSEKYEIKVRDWDAPGNIKDFISRVNAARRENVALQHLVNLRFLEVDNDRLIAYCKTMLDGSSAVIVVVNLDPVAAQAGLVRVPPEVIGVAPGASYDVHDALTGGRYVWSERNYVRLDPVEGEPAHILRIDRRS